jgi:hypothetical protein
MTPQQLTTLRAACFADPTAAAFFADQGNAAGLEAYMNAEASPVYTVWRSRVTQDEIMQNGFDWVQVDNLTVGKARIWEWMFDNDTNSINPSKANVRAGIEEAWKGTAAMLAVRAAVYVHCKRPALRVEKIFSTGLGSDATPGVMTLEGAISSVDAARLIYKDDGTIWTAQG